MLHSIDAGGSIWRAVGTSPPAAVGNTGGLDVVQGPFPTSLAIQPGERIALQPIDDGNTPIVVGTAGFDGIRYFTGVLPDGSSSMLAPGATMDSGQIVPIQAMVSFTPPPPPPPPPARTLTVTTSGSGTGTISSAGIDCGGGAAHHVCSTAYPDGTKVTLTATPSGASRFGGFTGGGCPATTLCTVTLNATKTVDGRFDAIPHARKRKPAFLGFSLAPHAIRAAPVPPMVSPGNAKSKWGTVIRFRLSDSAAVEFRVDECLPKPRRTRTLCYHPQPGGSFSINARKGPNVLRFTGFVARLGHSRVRRQGFSGSQLYPGHYRLEAQNAGQRTADPQRREDPVHDRPRVGSFAERIDPVKYEDDRGIERAGRHRHHGVLQPHVLAVTSGRSGRCNQAGRDDQTRAVWQLRQHRLQQPGTGGPVRHRRSGLRGQSAQPHLVHQWIARTSPARARALSARAQRRRLQPGAGGLRRIPEDDRTSVSSSASAQALQLSGCSVRRTHGPADFQSDFGTLVSFTEDRNFGSSTWTDVFHVFDRYGRWVAARVVHAKAGRHTFYWSGISDLQGRSGPLPPGPYTMVHEEFPGRIVAQVAFTIKPYHVGHTHGGVAYGRCPVGLRYACLRRVKIPGRSKDLGAEKYLQRRYRLGD